MGGSELFYCILGRIQLPTYPPENEAAETTNNTKRNDEINDLTKRRRKLPISSSRDGHVCAPLWLGHVWICPVWTRTGRLGACRALRKASRLAVDDDNDFRARRKE